MKIVVDLGGEETAIYKLAYLQTIFYPLTVGDDQSVLRKLTL